MADLIDRQAALKCRFNMYTGFMGNVPVVAVRDIDNLPAVDAVEVVRCKDCEREQTCKIAQRLGIYGYCSEGERRAENG